MHWQWTMLIWGKWLYCQRTFWSWGSSAAVAIRHVQNALVPAVNTNYRVNCTSFLQPCDMTSSVHGFTLTSKVTKDASCDDQHLCQKTPRATNIIATTSITRGVKRSRTKIEISPKNASCRPNFRNIIWSRNPESFEAKRPSSYFEYVVTQSITKVISL